MSIYCQIWLTCKDEEEASQIAGRLLEKKLIACAKLSPVNSQFRWEGEIQQNNEIMLVMDSRNDLFKEIEKEVSKIHSYDTPNLQSTRTMNISTKTKEWLSKELR